MICIDYGRGKSYFQCCFGSILGCTKNDNGYTQRESGKHNKTGGYSYFQVKKRY